jgi:hypothetical protein
VLCQPSGSIDVRRLSGSSGGLRAAGLAVTDHD